MLIFESRFLDLQSVCVQIFDRASNSEKLGKRPVFDRILVLKVVIQEQKLHKYKLSPGEKNISDKKEIFNKWQLCEFSLNYI